MTENSNTQTASFDSGVSVNAELEALEALAKANGGPNAIADAAKLLSLPQTAPAPVTPAPEPAKSPFKIGDTVYITGSSWIGRICTVTATDAKSTTVKVVVGAASEVGKAYSVKTAKVIDLDKALGTETALKFIEFLSKNTK